MDNYCNVNYGIPSSTVEIDMAQLSQHCYGASSIKQQLNEIINYSLVAVNKKNNFIKEPMVTRLFYCPSNRTATKYEISTIGSTVETPFKYQFSPLAHGIVEVYGTVEMEIPDASIRISLVPKLGQVGGEQTGDEYWYNNYYDNYLYYPYTRYSTTESTIVTVPINAVMRVIPYDKKNGVGDVNFTLKAWQNNPISKSIYIRKINIYIKYTPSDKGTSIKSISFNENTYEASQTYPESIFNA